MKNLDFIEKTLSKAIIYNFKNNCSFNAGDSTYNWKSHEALQMGLELQETMEKIRQIKKALGA